MNTYIDKSVAIYGQLCLYIYIYRQQCQYIVIYINTDQNIFIYQHSCQNMRTSIHIYDRAAVPVVIRMNKADAYADATAYEAAVMRHILTHFC